MPLTALSCLILWLVRLTLKAYDKLRFDLGIKSLDVNLPSNALRDLVSQNVFYFAAYKLNIAGAALTVVDLCATEKLLKLK